jgi:hypothetical protein
MTTATVHHIKPHQKVNVRERIRNIFKQSVDVNGGRQPLSIDEVRRLYYTLYLAPLQRSTSRIDSLASDGFLKRVNHGIYIWSDTAPELKPKGLYPAAALPKRHKPVPQQPFDVSTLYVSNALRHKWNLKLSVKAIGMLAKEGWLPYEQTGGVRCALRFQQSAVDALGRAFNAMHP